MAEALLARVVPPVSTPFGHPVVNGHYYTQSEELSGTANGTVEKITPLQYLNQYVEDITAQRLAQARDQSAQQQRETTQVNVQGLPIRGLPQSAQSALSPVDTKPVNHSAFRTAAVTSSRPSSAQQILDGLSQMSHSQSEERAATSVSKSAFTAPKPHAGPRYSIGSAQPLDLNDSYVMESSPSKGRSSRQPQKMNRPHAHGIDDATIHLPLSLKDTVPVQKPKGPPINDGFRSPEVSEGEEDDEYEDAQGDLEEEDGDTYTPGTMRGQTVIDSGRPEKITASVRSSVRPSSTKVGEYQTCLSSRT